MKMDNSFLYFYGLFGTFAGFGDCSFFVWVGAVAFILGYVTLGCFVIVKIIRNIRDLSLRACVQKTIFYSFASNNLVNRLGWEASIYNFFKVLIIPIFIVTLKLVYLAAICLIEFLYTSPSLVIKFVFLPQLLLCFIYLLVNIANWFYSEDNREIWFENYLILGDNLNSYITYLKGICEELTQFIMSQGKENNNIDIQMDGCPIVSRSLLSGGKWLLQNKAPSLRLKKVMVKSNVMLLGKRILALRGDQLNGLGKRNFSSLESTENKNNNWINIESQTINMDMVPIETITEVYWFLVNNEEFRLKNIGLFNKLKNKIDRINTKGDLKLLNYELVGELEDIYKVDENYIVEVEEQDEELNNEYGIFNMKLYQAKLQAVLNNLSSEDVYKMIFKIKQSFLNDYGSYTSSIHTSPSFCVYKGQSIDIVLHKFTEFYNTFISKYGVEEVKCHCYVFINKWVDGKQISDITKVKEFLIARDKGYLTKIQEDDKNYRSELELHNIQKGSYPFIIGKEYGILINDSVGSRMVNNREHEGVQDASLTSYYWFAKEFNKNLSKYYLKLKKAKASYSYDEIKALSDRLSASAVKLKKIKGKMNFYIIKVTSRYALNQTCQEGLTGKGAEKKVEVFQMVDEGLQLKTEWFETNAISNDRFFSGKEGSVIIRIIKSSGVRITFASEEWRILNIEVKYNCKKLGQTFGDVERNLHIGTFDFETWGSESAKPYFIGWKTKNKKVLYDVRDYNMSEDNMMLQFFNDLMVPENHNLYLYAHNMGNFDGVIALHYLIKNHKKHDYLISPQSNLDGKIIGIVIRKKLEHKKIIRITLMDSLNILDSSLRELSKVFNCKTEKGSYPYKLIEKLGISKGLEYKGEVPAKEYFENISNQDYNSLVERAKQENKGIWNSKDELEKYLNTDLENLYDIIMKFANMIYDDFNINITRVRTAAGLAYLIYSSNYYLADDGSDPSVKRGGATNHIYLIKGKIEKFIREGYFGGIVDNYYEYLDQEVYKYDVNSHYPNAMKGKAMPGGKPIYSNERDLNKIFGYVRAKVTSPSIEQLRVPILPIKKNGKIVLFRGTEYGTWFSEELKDVVKYGYIVEPIDCIQFEKVYHLFDKFVEDLFSKKANAKDPVLKYTYKIILNSLYGWWAIRPVHQQLKIVTNDKLDSLSIKEDIELLYQSALDNDGISFIKSKGMNDPDLIKLLKADQESSEDLSNEEEFFEAKIRGSNVSAVQHSAAITAYARIYLNQFKNMKDNPYLGGDTDSIILTSPLDLKWIGKGLGQFKLEYILKEGFNHSKKFYLTVTKDNQMIIRAKGINNKNSILNYEKFVELFKGIDITLEQIQFSKDFHDMRVGIKTVQKRIRGIENPDTIFKINKKFGSVAIAKQVIKSLAIIRKKDLSLVEYIGQKYQKFKSKKTEGKINNQSKPSCTAANLSLPLPYQRYEGCLRLPTEGSAKTRKSYFFQR
jgi:hypothetical protein